MNPEPFVAPGPQPAIPPANDAGPHTGWPTSAPQPGGARRTGLIIGLCLAALVLIPGAVLASVYVAGGVVDRMADDMIQEVESSTSITPGPTTAGGISAECKDFIDGRTPANVAACDHESLADIKKYGDSFEEQ